MTRVERRSKWTLIDGMTAHLVFICYIQCPLSLSQASGRRDITNMVEAQKLSDERLPLTWAKTP